MNENDFDATARAWLQDGPTRMSDRALLVALDEIHGTRQRRLVWPAWTTAFAGMGWRRRPVLQRLSMAVALGVGAVALVAVASVLLASFGSIDGPAAPSPSSPAAGATSSGGMWPQSSLAEVRLAQERAGAGDPAYAWQVGAQLVEGDPGNQVSAELIDRFIRDVLGWDSYRFLDGGEFSNWAGANLNGWVDGAVTGQRYLRCAAGATNALYPDESCAPTIDELHYESASIDIAQLAGQGRDGIWVVSGWRVATSFYQAHPAASEAQARDRLQAFLGARLAGAGADGLVRVVGDEGVPLLYATTSGAPYERYEIDRTDTPLWPDARMTFAVRLFANGDATVVEQQFGWSDGGGLWLKRNSTTENGRPIVLPFTSADGEVTGSAPDTWERWLPGKGGAAHSQARDVWFGSLWRSGAFFGSGDRIEFVDPVAYDAWCAAMGGSPVLTRPADAASIAQQLGASPDFESTAPAAATVGGLDALAMDVTLAPGGEACGIGMIEISRWIHTIGWDPGWRMRLYLVDLPDGMSVRTMAITVVAPEDRFDQVIAETAPIIDSIQFHPGATVP